MESLNVESKYEKQAREFLAKTGAVITKRWKRQGFYFDEDKAKRDIYTIVITRGERSYEFEFGQSIAKTFYNDSVKYLESSKAELRRQAGDFYPSDYDILSVITKSDPGRFEDFCSDCGYDSDSRRAEKAYNAVRAEWLNIERLFSDSEIAELQEIN